MNIVDVEFNGSGGSEMYRALILPELFPHQPRWRLENWSEDDLHHYWIDREKVA